MLRSALIPLIVALLVTLAGGNAAAQPEGHLVIAFDTSLAATRLEPYVVSTGAFAYGGYPDIDELLMQQAVERDRGKREALLHQVQRLMHERVMHAPIYEPSTVHGIGPRVAEAGVGLNTLLYFTAPYEDLRLRKP